MSKSAAGQASPLDRFCPWMNDPVLRRLQPKGLPQLYGDADLDMGESTVHTITAGILLYGLGFHFALQTGYRVFGNLNLYVSDDPAEYVSPDVMVVKLSQALPVQLTAYQVGPQTPAPLLVAEVLSPRTWQQGDLSRKPIVYSNLGVKEYIVADVTGEMLEQRLLLLRRQKNGRWIEEQDNDGGVTSRLGFRVVVDTDGQLRLGDVKTGKHYARPEEAQMLADRVRALEEELARLRDAAPQEEPKANKGKGRRPRS